MPRLVQIDEAGQLWDIVVEAGCDAKGTRRRKQERFRGGRRAAERRMRALQAHYDGLYKSPEKLTVCGLWEEFERLRLPQLAPKTAERYRELMRLDVLPYIGEVACAKLTPARLAELWAELAKTGKRPAHNRKRKEGDPAPEPRGLSPQTVWHAFCVFRAMWHWGMDLEIVLNDPTRPRAAKPPRPMRAEVVAEELGHALVIVEQARGTQMFMPAFLAVTTGMRLEECCGLTWETVDLEAKSARVVQAISALRGGELIFKGPKNAKSIRRVDLLDMTVEELRKQKTWQDRQRLHYGPTWNPRNLVCVKVDGDPLNPQTLSNNWRGWRNRRGIELTFHGLRHTWATFLAGAIGMNHAKDELGHADIKTTDGYVHILEEEREAVRAVKEAAVAAAIARYEEKQERERQVVKAIR